MNNPVVFILVAFLLSATKGFTQVDSVKRLGQLAYLFDSLSRLSEKKWITDSLTVSSWSDSVMLKINQKFTSRSLELNRKIDSLKQLQQPIKHLTHLLDSISAMKNKLITEAETKRSALHSKIKGRLEQWQAALKSKLGLDSSSLGSAIPAPYAKVLEKLGVPALDLNGMELPEIPTLNTADFQDLNLSPDLASINQSLSFDKLGRLKEIQGKLSPVNEQLSQVKVLTQNPDQAIEASLKEIEQIKQIQDQIDIAGEIENNELIKNAKQLENPAALVGESKQLLVAQAMDHFSGKGERLQEAMESISKYKQKFPTISNLNDLPKRRPNEMRGKPVIERIVPGIAIQLQKKGDDVLADFNLYFGYRFTSRFTSGAGWNQRVGYNTDHYNWSDDKTHIYGPRIFSEYKLNKGFSPRVEIESMNTFVPPFVKKLPVDPGRREWVWGAFVGMKKDYKLMKKIKGTAMIMIRLFDPHRKSPYADVINARFGFEFPMKKKVK